MFRKKLSNTMDTVIEYLVSKPKPTEKFQLYILSILVGQDEDLLKLYNEGVFNHWLNDLSYALPHSHTEYKCALSSLANFCARNTLKMPDFDKRFFWEKEDCDINPMDNSIIDPSHFWWNIKEFRHLTHAERVAEYLGTDHVTVDLLINRLYGSDGDPIFYGNYFMSLVHELLVLIYFDKMEKQVDSGDDQKLQSLKGFFIQWLEDMDGVGDGYFYGELQMSLSGLQFLCERFGWTNPKFHKCLFYTCPESPIIERICKVKPPPHHYWWNFYRIWDVNHIGRAAYYLTKIDNKKPHEEKSLHLDNFIQNFCRAFKLSELPSERAQKMFAKHFNCNVIMNIFSHLLDSYPSKPDYLKKYPQMILSLKQYLFTNFNLSPETIRFFKSATFTSMLKIFNKQLLKYEDF